MGVLIDGEWHEDGQVQTDSRGSFVRDDSIFRNWITADGAPGFSGEGGFNAEAGRYHLFVSPSCPWAHRAMILRKLKRLEDVVSMSSADRPKSAGWSYSRGIDDLEAGNDGIFRLHQVYTAAKRKATRARSRSRPCGTANAAPSSTTSPRKSYACSTRPSTA